MSIKEYTSFSLIVCPIFLKRSGSLLTSSRCTVVRQCTPAEIFSIRNRTSSPLASASKTHVGNCLLLAFNASEYPNVSLILISTQSLPGLIAEYLSSRLSSMVYTLSYAGINWVKYFTYSVFPTPGNPPTTTVQ